VVTPTDGRFRLQWNRVRLRSNSGDTDFYVEPVNVSLCPVGQVFTLRPERSGDTMRLAAASWNTWGTEQVVSGSQVLSVKVVEESGNHKLQFVSLS